MRRFRWLHSVRAIVGALVLVGAVAGTSDAQSGTRVRRTITFISTGTATIDFQVAGPIPASDATTLVLEFATDGNNALPSANPFPTPASVSFTLTKDGTAASGFTAADAVGGGATPTGITGKSIRMDYTPHGRYALTITHDADVSPGTTESWKLSISGLPTIRGIGTVNTGQITGLNPVGACTGGGGGVCPTCPRRVCLKGIYDYRIPIFVWPPKPPGPDPDPICPMCGQFFPEFDRNQFDRVAVAVMPTRENGLAGGCSQDLKFNVTGGEAVGPVFEGGGGSCAQMVQYPKGKPATVTILSANRQLATVQAEPQRLDEERPGGRLLFGLGGLILGVLAGLALNRGRGGRMSDPGQV